MTIHNAASKACDRATPRNEKTVWTNEPGRVTCDCKGGTS